MTSFDVWMWLKLDDIRNALSFVFYAFGLAGPAGLGAIVGMASMEVNWLWAKSWRPLLAMALIGWTCGLASVLVPSTRQYATMRVVPVVIDSRAFTNDIPELYGMAVDLLKAKIKKESKEP
jgi:hypothetical protein